MAIWGPTAIASDADDGELRTGTGWVQKNEDGYPNGEYFAVGVNGANTTHGGLRFLNVTVPAGATINDATLRVWITTAANNDAALAIVTVFADVGANRQDALGASHHPESNWTNSTASVQIASLAVASPREIDVTTIAQELVDLGGWTSGDNICFSLDPDANGSDTYWWIYIADYDADTMAMRATLEIDYTESGGANSAIDVTTGLLYTC